MIESATSDNWQYNYMTHENADEKRAFLDQGIEIRRAEYMASGDPWDLEGLIWPMLLKAELIEKQEGISSDAELLYEEIGEHCLTIEKAGFGMGPHTSAAFVAGLCFEKSRRTQIDAFNSYEIVLQMKKEVEANFTEDSLNLSEEEQIDVGFTKMISFNPVWLQISLASLKCERKDLFEEVVACQIQQFLSLFKILPDELRDSDDLRVCAQYMKALLETSRVVLDSDGLENVKDEFETTVVVSSGEEKKAFKKTLFSIYKSSKEYSVNEIVNGVLRE